MKTELIERVREHPCLYDVTNKYYRDHNMRQEAWEDIALQMNSNAETVKLAWIKLRNAFISAKNRRKTKSGQPVTNLPAWKFEKEMAFLVPFLDARQSSSKIDLKRTYHEPSDEEDDSKEHIFGDKSEPLQSQQQSLQTFQGTSVNIFNRKRKSETPAQESTQTIKHNASLRTLHPEAVSNPHLDETDMFYLSMAQTVKRLPLLEQAKIRLQFCHLVSEAEIRHIENIDSSLGSPSTSPLCA